MKANKTFYIFTLGCKVNQYESQSLIEFWERHGWNQVAIEESSIAVINSCAITAKALVDVRAEVRKIHKLAPQTAIIVTGCATAAAKEELQALEGVQLVVDQQEKTRMLSEKFLLALEHGISSLKGSFIEFPDMQKGKDSLSAEEEKKDRSFPTFAISGYARSRAVLKIQDGCSHFCAYCIVPYARGKAISRPIQDSLSEANRLLEAGFGEIVISGINLRQYHHTKHDFWDFVSLLEQEFAQKWDGKARFRISSLEPGQLTDRALDVLSRAKMIAPQLHLSLQSGSESVLHRMKRGHYTPKNISDFLQELRGIWSLFGLGVDVISGFPGETEEEHEATVALLKSLPLTYAHVFPYSQRPGTLASSMPDQIENSTKKQRAKELREIASQGKTAFLQTVANLDHVTVAVEGEKAEGLCEYYVECTFPEGVSLSSGPLVLATPIGSEKGRLLAKELTRESLVKK